MLNKVTKLPKSRFQVFGFGEKNQITGRNATHTSHTKYGVELKASSPPVLHNSPLYFISVSSNPCSASIVTCLNSSTLSILRRRYSIRSQHVVSVTPNHFLADL